jgi:hypothetical protein
MSNLDLKREVKRGVETELQSPPLVGRVLRAIRGFEKGAIDWIVTQSGNFLKTARGWHISLSEIGDWYELEEAIT